MLAPHKTFSKVWHLVKAHRRLRAAAEELASSEDTVVQAVGRALQKTRRMRASAVERRWIDRIEDIRRELLQSSDLIVLGGFGSTRSQDALPTAHPYADNQRSAVVRDRCRQTSKSPKWAFLLFQLIRETSPSVCLEMGTSLGISAAYQAAALEINGNGRLVTLEGVAGVARIAKSNLRRLRLARTEVVVGRFEDTLGDVLQDHGPFGYVFVDGHHDEHATWNYWDRLYSHLTDRAVVVFDDISWSDGMRRAWKKISVDQRVSTAVDLSTMGICIVSHPPAESSA